MAGVIIEAITTHRGLLEFVVLVLLGTWIATVETRIHNLERASRSVGLGRLFAHEPPTSKQRRELDVDCDDEIRQDWEP